MMLALCVVGGLAAVASGLQTTVTRPSLLLRGHQGVRRGPPSVGGFQPKTERSSPKKSVFVRAATAVKEDDTTKAVQQNLAATKTTKTSAQDAVELAPCPLTQWGEPFADVLAEQKKARSRPAEPFTFELKPPKEAAGDIKEQSRWLQENAEMVREKMRSHGAVIFRGWELVEDPNGFREAYEALSLRPCLDPLHAVSARPMVDKGSAVYEAVNKESRANFFIGMHNEFVGTRSPRAAMFVCFKAADEGGEFLLADGRKIFRDVKPELLKRLYEKQIRYSVMELPFFGFLDAWPEVVASPASKAVRALVEAAVNAKVDFDVSLNWLSDASAYSSNNNDDESSKTNTLQARAPAQPPVVRHPETGAPTWFCNVHSHSAALRKQRESLYGEEQFTSGASQINKSDMYFGDDDALSKEDLKHLDDVTNKNIVYVKMRPGDAVLLDNYQTMHGRNVFKGKRKHAVTWFE